MNLRMTVIALIENVYAPTVMEHMKEAVDSRQITAEMEDAYSHVLADVENMERRLTMNDSSDVLKLCNEFLNFIDGIKHERKIHSAEPGSKSVH